MKKVNIFHLVLTTLIILFVADISMKIINSRLDLDLPEQTTKKPTFSGEKTVKPFSAFSRIAERKLFEKPAPPDTEKNNQEEDLSDHPLTNLKLILKGTVVSTKGNSFAVIEDEKLRSQDLYHINDSISSGVTIASILNDRVVINRNGNKELLLMFQEDKKGRHTPARSDRQAASPLVIKKSEIREAVTDLRSIMRDVRIIPHFASGKRDGFTVTYVRRGSRLAELGLLRNDIIKDINGTPAGNFKNIFEIFNKYADSDSLDLGIERNNEYMNISYTLE
ncbi:MAG: hypothetical protein GXP58_08150 [Deltaproteobacteria bacterium]|nr:hypothetical protein [Deltaproteobacteria bacterium]